MPRYLLIAVRFLSGRYHGEEWPPSPSRLFQAMVAGAHVGCRVMKWPAAKVALLWFERLDAPGITAVQAPMGHSYRAFVPNNDSDSPKVVAAVSAGICPHDAIRREGLLTPKNHRPWLVDSGDEAAVQYAWQLPDCPESDQFARQICGLARLIVALGWGIDTVIADGWVADEIPSLPGQRYLPVREKTSLNLCCPAPGFLEDLEYCHTAFQNRYAWSGAVDTDARPRCYRVVSYCGSEKILNRLCAPFIICDDNGHFRSYRWEDGILVSAWLRHVVTRRFEKEGWDPERVKSYVAGHAERGLENDRLSYVPLPSIGHMNSDGKYRRVLVSLPSGDGGEALAILDRLEGEELVALDGSSMGWLMKPRKHDPVLQTYLGTSTTWATVTPVVLHGIDREGRHFRMRKAEKLFLQAFAKAGYAPEDIKEFSFQAAPFWRGAGSALGIRLPQHLKRWPRYHVRLTFQHPTSGPVLAGIGRHYGLGLFAPLL